MASTGASFSSQHFVTNNRHWWLGGFHAMNAHKEQTIPRPMVTWKPVFRVLHSFFHCKGHNNKESGTGLFKRMSRQARSGGEASRFAFVVATCRGSPQNATCARRSSADLHTAQTLCDDTGGNVRQNLHLFCDFNSKCWGTEPPTGIKQCNYWTRGREPTRRDSEIISFCGNYECVAAASSPKEAQSW